MKNQLKKNGNANFRINFCFHNPGFFFGFFLTLQQFNFFLILNCILHSRNQLVFLFHD